MSSASKDVVVNGGAGDSHDDEGPLPGFRFHPTDEELVSFYLKRKVEKRRPLSIEIIKQTDIYKHDPWDLAKASSIGDKEWYFYCKRGRKYRNSIRPNRVTGSGFWKATGIDRPIYSNGGEGHQCIGLKKSLVYYRGSAGKGTKTDWMMHEFRLPSDLQQHDDAKTNPKDTAPEAEIWTLCRIFKRSKRHNPDWRELSSRNNAVNSSSNTSSIDSNPNQECYISFATHQAAAAPSNGYSNIFAANEENNNDNINNVYVGNQNITTGDQKNVQFHADHQQQWNVMDLTQSCTPRTSMLNNFLTNEGTDLQTLAYCERNWDDLNTVVEFAVKNPFL